MSTSLGTAGVEGLEPEMTGAPGKQLELCPLFAENILQSSEFLITVGVLLLTLIVGAGVLYVTDRWRKRQMEDSLDSTELLSEYKTMLENGELTEPEYTAIRTRLIQQMRSEVKPSTLPEFPSPETKLDTGEADSQK